jgi:hypothetical protein
MKIQKMESKFEPSLADGQTQIGSITKCTVLYWEIVKRLHWGCANVGLLCFVRNTLVPLVVQEMFSEFTFLCRMLATEKF